MKPFSVETTAATAAIERETQSVIQDLVPGQKYKVFD